MPPSIGWGRASSTVTVCLTDGKRCRDHTFNCDFSKEAHLIDIFENEKSFKHGLNHIKKASSKLPEAMTGQYVSTIDQRDKRGLSSTNFVTCSALILHNQKCRQANLSHYIKNNPRTMVETLKHDLRRDSRCADSLDETEVFMMVSSDEKSDAYDAIEGHYMRLDGFYTRRLVCGLREAFPKAPITIFESRKERGSPTGDFDQVELNLSGQRSTVSITRFSSVQGREQAQRTERISLGTPTQSSVLQTRENEATAR